MNLALYLEKGGNLQFYIKFNKLILNKLGMLLRFIPNNLIILEGGVHVKHKESQGNHG